MGNKEAELHRPLSAQPESGRRANRSSIDILFAGQSMRLDGRAALFWPDQSLLVVSDLHLEKGSAFGRFHTLLPLYDAADTLQRLAALIADYQPENVLCLGDSFHDSAALNRMQPRDFSRLQTMVAEVNRWIWILGNHDSNLDPLLDPLLPDGIAGERLASYRCGNILFIHEPSEDLENSSRALVFGHYHPKTRIRLLQQRIVGKCFLATDQRLLMPAFGTYTGGLFINDPAIARALLPEPVQKKSFLIYGEKVYPLPAR